MRAKFNKMKQDVQEYLKTSSIHGLRYISKRFRLVERIFWGVCLILTAFYASKLFYDLVSKMSNFPVVVYLSDKSVPVSEIYFPAVTVCPDFIPQIPRQRIRAGINEYAHHRYQKNTMMNEFYESDEYLAETVDERMLKLSYVEILRRIEDGRIDPYSLGMKILKRLQVVDLITNRNIFNKLNFSIPADDFLDTMNDFEKEFNRDSTTYFFWINEEDQLLSEVITPYGLCFTFNMALVDDFIDLNATSDDFYIQTFYTHELYKPIPPEYLPRKISTSIAGLYVQLYVSYGYFESFEANTDGLLVILHGPFELPSSSTSRFLIKSFQYSEITIHPELYSIDESLTNYSPEDRNCYLETERELKFFKKYTKANCIQECLTDFMINRCGCVEFFMIRNSTTRICSANENNCTESARDNFVDKQQSCGCLQPCNYIKYEFEHSLESHGPVYPVDFRLDAKITFNNDNFNHFIRKQQFNELDFLSYVGGLLGLFAGFSVLSFVEIVYLFTIQVFVRKFSRASSKVTPFNEDLVTESQAEALRKYVVSYLKESSIHGLLQISSTHLVQKFLWIIFVLMSLTACAFMMSETREKIPDSRVVAYDDNLQIIENISFPALTFVPEFFERPDVNDRNMFVVGQPTSHPLVEPTDEFFRLESIVAFCEPRYSTFVDGKTYDLRPYIADAIKSVSEVEWFKQQFAAFNRDFQPILAEVRTQRGIGFSFNLLDAEELFNIKKIKSVFGYAKNVTIKHFRNSTKFLKNVKISNENLAELKLIIKNQRLSGEYVCIPPAILVHNIDESPTFHDQSEFMALQYGMEVDIEVIPEIIRTDRDLKSIDPQTRECYFEGEKKLKFFKKYSQKNCLIECFANFTMDRCNCTDMIQPYEQLVLCPIPYKVNELSCPLKIFPEYISLDMPSSPNCSCLPTCDLITYHTKYFHKFSTQSDEISINLRVNTEDAILFRRYQQFTFSDVVSYVGGLLGLFAGISMLSIVEFFYFFVIRVAVNVLRGFRGRH